jgi:tetratricopeptide (TPR) repeat protein
VTFNVPRFRLLRSLQQILTMKGESFKIVSGIGLIIYFTYQSMKPFRRHIIRTLALLLCVACLFPHCRQDRLATAKALLENGDFLAARKIYDRLLDGQPQNFAAHFGLAMTWSAEAIYKTEIGLAGPPDWYPAIYHMTVAAQLQTNDRVRRTLAILHFNLGACYVKQGDREAAIQRISQAVAYDSTLLKADNLLGALYHEQGDFDNAERCYRRILLINPGYAMAHFNLGALAWARKDFREAEKDFTDAVSDEPDNAYFKTWLSKAHTSAGGR